MKRALITGAAGFTGQYLRQELAEHGWEVWGLGQTPAPTDFLNGYVQTNLLETDHLSEVIQRVQPDAVFHLAAIAFVGHGSPHDFYRVNVLGTRNLLHALTKLPRAPQSVLLASSANVYGNASEGQLNESTPYNPANDYAVSKAAMEMMARLWQTHLPITLVRPFNYTGIGQSPEFLVPKIVDHFVRKAPVIELGNLEVWRDFSDVRDVVRAYRLLAEQSPIGETVNICSGRTHSLLEVVNIAKAVSGHELEVQVNPAFVRANEVKTLYGDAGKLSRLLGGWQPRAFDQTLHWMLTGEQT